MMAERAKAAALWDQLITAHRMSQVHRTTIADTCSNQVFKDEAVKGLTFQADRIIAILDKMGEQQLLVHVGMILRQRGV